MQKDLIEFGPTNKVKVPRNYKETAQIR